MDEGQQRLRWRKSSHSTVTDEQSTCVEVAGMGGVIGVRDSKDPEGPVLRLTRANWVAVLDIARGH